MFNFWNMDYKTFSAKVNSIVKLLCLLLVDIFTLVLYFRARAYPSGDTF
jgi:hypothetical protein